MVYLDNAATTYHKPPQVRQAILDAMQRCASAARGGYPSAQYAGKLVYDVREKLADFFHVDDPAKVIFTYNATMGINMAIKGLAQPGHILTSGYEHNAVVRPLQALSREGINWSAAVSPLYDQQAMLEAYNRSLRADTRLVICNHVSNVFGNIAPIEEIDRLCWEHGLPLVIDASQSAGCIALDCGKLRATQFVCMPGHKALYGPQGTGVLLHIGTLPCHTILEGGTGSDSASLDQPAYDPERFESGTVNVAGIAGLGAGIDYLRQADCAALYKKEWELSQFAAQALRECEQVTVYTADDPVKQSSVFSFLCEGWDCEEVAQALGSAGIAVRAGLHCAPFAHRSAGTFPCGTVRVSPGAWTTKRDMEKLVRAVYALCKRGTIPPPDIPAGQA